MPLLRLSSEIFDLAHTVHCVLVCSVYTHRNIPIDPTIYSSCYFSYILEYAWNNYIFQIDLFGTTIFWLIEQDEFC